VIRTILAAATGIVQRWQIGRIKEHMPANSNKNKTVVVTGATGQQGGAAVRRLRERGFPVRALTRDPEQPRARALVGHGTEVIRGDMDDEASLTRAMDGVYGVHSVQDWRQGIEGEVRQGVRVANAAKRSNNSLFVYSSVASADQRTGIPHFDSKFRIEETIRGTGMRYTIVRPVFFMENWLGMRQAIEGGALSLPLDPETRLQMVAVDDIGGVVATALERLGKWQDRTFELAGDELSMSDLAHAFTGASGHEVRYVQVPWDEFEQQAGKELTLMYRWLRDTGYHVDIGAVRSEYPKLTTFDHWMNSNWHTVTQAAR
jgi:uncharacterized protein YbjT (DUF2867 family)